MRTSNESRENSHESQQFYTRLFVKKSPAKTQSVSFVRITFQSHNAIFGSSPMLRTIPCVINLLQLEMEFPCWIRVREYSLFAYQWYSTQYKYYWKYLKTADSDTGSILPSNGTTGIQLILILAVFLTQNQPRNSTERHRIHNTSARGTQNCKRSCSLSWQLKLILPLHYLTTQKAWTYSFQIIADNRR